MGLSLEPVGVNGTACLPLLLLQTSAKKAFKIQPPPPPPRPGFFFVLGALFAHYLCFEKSMLQVLFNIPFDRKDETPLVPQFVFLPEDKYLP